MLGESIHRPLSAVEVSLEANRCLNCYDAPCTNACPTHIDVASFIRKITSGNVTGSAHVIMEANPMGASCARVCPTEQLCEGACVYHAAGDSPIRIGDLQRFAVDHVMNGNIALFTPGAPTGFRVAVIGAGPAGLSAARDLRRFGHAVTLFDAHDDAGGLNTYGIVPFRLDTQTALWEAGQVLALGAELRANMRIGIDVPFQQISAEYDAIVIACGMGAVPRLNIEGEDLPGVWDALDFIERAKRGLDTGRLGAHVAVIGAGNTAIDALTCAKRLAPGARVTCYYRRGAGQMTAYQFEYDFAKQEGIEFRFFCAPVRVLGGERVEAVEFVQTAADATRLPDSAFIEPVTTFIRAIGQSRLLAEIEAFGIEHDRGVIRVNEQLRTSRAGVYAAGDCIFEKGMREAMVVEAAEQGKRVAAAIHESFEAVNHG
ncbi:MAG: NAD(P)-dependent oxidoreductase [Candidatus Baltobacteraceae bacterium]